MLAANPVNAQDGNRTESQGLTSDRHMPAMTHLILSIYFLSLVLLSVWLFFSFEITIGLFLFSHASVLEIISVPGLNSGIFGGIVGGTEGGKKEPRQIKWLWKYLCRVLCI